MKIKKDLKCRKLVSACFLTLFLITGFFSFAQESNIVVIGVVTSAEDGLPVPGASVLKKGSKLGVITDFDGVFKIEAQIGDVLEISYLGLVKQSQMVKSKSMNVILKSSVEGLDEVVVIGYGAVKKKELTGAVATLKADDLANQITSDLGSSLQGQISGVNVVTSGEPGSNSEILIRGITSISGSNTPLYVVDGIPQEGDPRINPSEIQSIDVLKDASSAAIYGTRGAAGVILITTKRGEAGPMRVRVDVSKSFESLGRGQRLLNAIDQTYSDVLLARNLTSNSDDAINIAYLTNAPDRYQYDNDISRLLFTDNANTQNYNINVSGGTNDLKYSFVGTIFDRKGVVIGTDYQRFNSRSNVNYKRDKLTVDLGVGIAREYTDRGAANTISQLLRYQPTQPILAANANSLELFGGDDFNTNVSLIQSLNSKDQTRLNKSFTNVSVNYDILKSLSLTTRAGITDTYSTRKRFRPTQSTYDVQRGLEVIQPSFIRQDASRNTAITWDAALNFKAKLIENHNFALTTAVSGEEYVNEEFSVTKDNVQDNNIPVLNTATGNASATSGFDYTTRLFGMLARVQYDYKGRYLISSSVRRDGSSRFAKQNRFGIFPSVSAAWNISDEAFFKSMLSVVNNLKLRVSNGTVGNQNFQDYFYSTSIYRDHVYAFGDGSVSNGTIQTTIGNSDVKWESSTQKNIGIDIGLFKNKVSITAEYYQTDKKDMLFNLTIPPSVGLDDSSSGYGAPNTIRTLSNNNQVVLNIGNMTNSGYELAIGYRDNIGKLKFKMNGTFTTNQNKVTKIADGFDGPILTNDTGIVPGGNASTSQITAIAKGYEAGAYFVFATDGIANTAEKLAEFQKIRPSAKMGDLIYKDVDGDGVFQSVGDRVYAGSGLPKYELGYNVSFDYNNFDLYVNMYAAIGHEIVNGARATAIGFGRSSEILNSYSDVNPTGTLPAYRGIFSAHPNYQPNTDLFIEDGSYLRIRNITFGYNIPKKIASSIGFEKLRFFFTGQNLFTFTKYTGYNPEVGGNVSSRGLDKGSYPMTKMYVAGLQFNF